MLISQTTSHRALPEPTGGCAASTPRAGAGTPPVPLLWVGAVGLWAPLSKGSPASPAAGTGGAVPRLPLCSVSAGRQGWALGSITHHWASPQQLLDCPFSKNCRCWQRVSWLFSWQCCCKKAFLVAVFHHQNDYLPWIRADLNAGEGWLPKLGCLCQTLKAVELFAMSSPELPYITPCSRVGFATADSSLSWQSAKGGERKHRPEIPLPTNGEPW